MTRPPTILIADDEAPIRHILSAKLVAAGYVVVEARDGEEVLTKVASEMPDLLITDNHMPGISGIDLAVRLRAAPATADLPVIMLTACGFAIQREDLARTNIRELLSKPFSPRTVVSLVRAILAAPAAGPSATAA